MICDNCKGNCESCNKVVFPAPPVYTGNWNELDWRNYIRKNAVDAEPEIINNSFGTWKSTGERDSKGKLLYKLEK